MRALVRVLLGTLVVLLAWILAADRGLVPGREVVERLREEIARPRPPPLPPTARYDGEPLHFTLREPAAEFYGDDREPAHEDSPFITLAEEAGARYDPALAQAAREYAYLYANQSSMLPGAALTFLLDAAGVVGWGVRQSVMVSNSTSDEPTARYLRDLLRERPARLGVGLLDLEGRRIVVALSASEGPRMAPVPRGVDLLEPVVLRGRLPAGQVETQIVAMGPDLRVVDVPVDGAGEAFSATLTPAVAGQWTIEVLARGPFGPAPVTQLTITVGDLPPEALATTWPRDETGVETSEDAEELAAILVGEDRAHFGLPALVRDPALDAIARAHAEDMREHDYVGHQSARTGGPGDRLGAAGFAVIGLAENVALNNNLGDAQSGLMRSLGHRRNLLSTDLTHVGLGAVREGESWYLTQLFATPMPRVGAPETAADEVLAALNRARRAVDAPPLAAHALLTQAARRAAAGGAPTPRGVLDAAGDLLRGKASAWVGKMAGLHQFEPPSSLFARQFRRAGVAVHQALDQPPPNIHVVLVLSQ